MLRCRLKCRLRYRLRYRLRSNRRLESRFALRGKFTTGLRCRLGWNAVSHGLMVIICEVSCSQLMKTSFSPRMGGIAACLAQASRAPQEWL